MLAHTLAGVAEVAPHQAAVGPGGRLPRELGQELNAALYDQRAGLLQPPALAVAAHIAHGAQEKVSHLGICTGERVRGYRDDVVLLRGNLQLQTGIALCSAPSEQLINHI